MDLRGLHTCQHQFEIGKRLLQFKNLQGDFDKIFEAHMSRNFGEYINKTNGGSPGKFTAPWCTAALWNLLLSGLYYVLTKATCNF